MLDQKGKSADGIYLRVYCNYGLWTLKSSKENKQKYGDSEWQTEKGCWS